MTRSYQNHEDPDATSQTPVIRIYQGVGCDSSTAQSIYDNVVSSFNKPYSNNRIDGYEVWWYTTTFDATDSKWGDKYVKGAFHDYRENNGYTSRGTHVILHDQDTKYGAASDPGLAWQNDLDAQVHLGSSSDIYNSNSTMHEILHTLISESEVSDLIDTSEHDLGKNFELYSGSYESALGDQGGATEGECTSSYGNDSWVSSMTECSEKGLKRSKP